MGRSRAAPVVEEGAESERRDAICSPSWRASSRATQPECADESARSPSLPSVSRSPFHSEPGLQAWANCSYFKLERAAEPGRTGRRNRRSGHRTETVRSARCALVVVDDKSTSGRPSPRGEDTLLSVACDTPQDRTGLSRGLGSAWAGRANQQGRSRRSGRIGSGRTHWSRSPVIRQRASSLGCSAYRLAACGDAEFDHIPTLPAGPAIGSHGSFRAGRSWALVGPPCSKVKGFRSLRFGRRRNRRRKRGRYCIHLVPYPSIIAVWGWLHPALRSVTPRKRTVGWFFCSGFDVCWNGGCQPEAHAASQQISNGTG